MATYQWMTLDVPGGVLTQPSDINNKVEVVGSYQDKSGTWHGFTDLTNVPGAIATIDAPLSVQTFVRGVNNNGDIAGSFTKFNSLNMPIHHGFAIVGGNYVELSGPPGWLRSDATDVNDSGQVVGTYVDYTGTHGFVYQNDTYATIPIPYGNAPTVAHLDDAGNLVGKATAPDILIADLIGPGSNPTPAYMYNINTGAHFSFVYKNNGNLPVWGTDATGNNIKGQIVGYSTDTGSFGHGFIANPTATGVNPTPFTISAAPNNTYPQAINDSSFVVGYYQANGTHGFVAVPANTATAAATAGREDLDLNVLARADGLTFRNDMLPIAGKSVTDILGMAGGTHYPDTVPASGLAWAHTDPMSQSIGLPVDRF